jgi:glycine/D-amino acid oxidase-like deaminating enzyme
LQNHYRYIIQGAGASGLWLAHSLNEAGLLAFDQLLIVEEKGMTKTNKLDKTALSREIIQLVSTKI